MMNYNIIFSVECFCENGNYKFNLQLENENKSR